MADTKSTPCAAPSRLLTEDADTFRKTLEAGDVLLFDTMAPVSWLVKLFENRPVSHAAIYLGNGTYAEMGLPKYADPERHHVVLHAARATSLDHVLTKPPSGPWALVRTITALRHRMIVADATRAQFVVDAARRYIDTDPRYDYAGLVALGLPAMLRAYGTSFDLTRRLGILGTPMEWVANAIIATLVEEATPGDGVSLTCSEFVYRCFAEAGHTTDGRRPLVEGPDLTPSIVNPLATWKDPGLGVRLDLPGPHGESGLSGDFQQFRAGPPPFAGPDPEADIWDVLEFDGELRDQIVGGPPDPPEGVQVAALFGGGGLGRAMDAFKRFIEANVAKGKHQRLPAGPAGAVFADTVTPRDLWGSASFAVVSVLHRPPGPDDRLSDTDPPPTHP